MSAITQEHINALLKIFLKHDLVVDMDTLINEYDYNSHYAMKKLRILKIIPLLEKDLKRFVRSEIIEHEGEIYEIRFL